MSDFELKAFVTNLGKYNEGELVGEWVSFPTTPEEIRQVYDRIVIGHADDFGNPYEEIFITDYDSDLYGITEELGEYSSLEAINYLGVRLKELDRYDLEKYKAVLESCVGLPESGITGLINLTYNLDRFEIIPGVHDDSDLGYYYVEEAGIYDTKSMGALARYVDYEAFGRDLRLEEGGTYSDAGYVRDDNSSWDYEFDGTREGIPEEYLLFVNDEDPIIFSGQEKETILKAMEAAGYSFDKMESTDDNLRFFSEGGAVMQMESWSEAKEWLEGVVFDDPTVSDRVEKILHPERFEGQGITEIKPFSVLKELAEKKKEAMQARPPVGKSAKVAGAEIG